MSLGAADDAEPGVLTQIVAQSGNASTVQTSGIEDDADADEGFVPIVVGEVRTDQCLFDVAPAFVAALLLPASKGRHRSNDNADGQSDGDIADSRAASETLTPTLQIVSRGTARFWVALSVPFAVGVQVDQANIGVTVQALLARAQKGHWNARSAHSEDSFSTQF